MNEEEQVAPASAEQTEETEAEETTDTEEEAAEETPEELKARLAKAEEVAKNQRIRAEKAEGKLKEGAKPTTAPGDLSPTDLYALFEAKVPQEDISEVSEYAKLKGISVADALKSNVVKTILADNAEKRATAQATATGSTRRAGNKTTDEALLAKASKGELPESDEEINRLIRAKKGYKN